MPQKMLMCQRMRNEARVKERARRPRLTEKVSYNGGKSDRQRRRSHTNENTYRHKHGNARVHDNDEKKRAGTAPPDLLASAMHSRSKPCSKMVPSPSAAISCEKATHRDTRMSQVLMRQPVQPLIMLDFSASRLPHVRRPRNARRTSCGRVFFRS